MWIIVPGCTAGDAGIKDLKIQAIGSITYHYCNAIIMTFLPGIHYFKLHDSGIFTERCKKSLKNGKSI